jgi:hypothetical protein
MKTATPDAAKQREAAATVPPALFRMKSSSLLEVNVSPDRSAVSQVRTVFPHNRAAQSMAVLLLGVVLGAGVLFAEGQVFWQEGGVVICESTWAIRQAAVSDDSGGVFVVWYDKRGENGSVMAQHVDRDGNTLWQKNGTFVGAGDPHDVNQLSVLPDGRGGLVAVWQRGDDLTPLYRHQVTAQRLDATGAALWDSSGVVVTGTDSGFMYEVATVSDGRGGAIVAWTAVAGKPGGIDSLIVQRIDSVGNLCWGNMGLVLAADSVHAVPLVCTDDAGGVCVVWRLDGEYVAHSLAQHIDSTGMATWPGNGVLLFVNSNGPACVFPQSGGYLIPGGPFADSIRTQRISSDGQILWGPDGCLVYGGPPDGYRGVIRAVAVSGGRSYVVWSEERGEPIIRMYAQLLSGSGERQWGSLGVSVGTTDDNDSYFFGCVEAGGGLIASWSRNSGGATLNDIYAQQVDTAGRLLWGDPGLGVATDSGHQYWAPSVVTDSRGGAIVTWGFSYGVGHVGLSVQRVGDVAAVTDPIHPAERRSCIHACPSPARMGVEILLPRPSESVVIADALGRVVRELTAHGRDLTATWDLRDMNGSRVPAGVYVLRQRESGTSLGRVVVVNP